MSKRFLIIIIGSCLLAACGSRAPRLEKPGIQIVELTMNRPGEAHAQGYDLIVRVRNTSEIEMVVSDFEFELLLDGGTAGSHTASIDLPIPALSNENVQVSGQISQQQAQSLISLQGGRRGQMPYALEGVLSSQGRSFELVYQGWLSRSPGKSGSFR
jgi:LEA14-like dessication related protein